MVISEEVDASDGSVINKHVLECCCPVWVSPVCLSPSLPVLSCKGLELGGMGQASPQPLGLRAMGGITLNVNIMS